MANGAHYFLYGSLKNQPPGVLQESGFGVTFPNYIVDVKKDDDGKYTEAIQFQCLERGGVRIFEGINFLSRAPAMSDAELAAMHGRAKAAGMDPYGSDPEQMHYVPHAPQGAVVADLEQRNPLHVLHEEQHFAQAALELFQQAADVVGRVHALR